MSKFPELREFSKLRGSFVLTPFPSKMAASCSAGSEDSGTVSYMSFAFRVQKIFRLEDRSLAPKCAGWEVAVSSKNGTLEPYLSDLQVSKAESE